MDGFYDGMDVRNMPFGHVVLDGRQPMVGIHHVGPSLVAPHVGASPKLDPRVTRGAAPAEQTTSSVEAASSR